MQSSSATPAEKGSSKESNMDASKLPAKTTSEKTSAASTKTTPSEPPTQAASAEKASADTATANDTDKPPEKKSEVPKITKKKSGKIERDVRMGQLAKKWGLIAIGDFEVPADKAPSIVTGMAWTEAARRGRVIEVAKRVLSVHNHNRGRKTNRNLKFIRSVGRASASIFFHLLDNEVDLRRHAIVNGV